MNVVPVNSLDKANHVISFQNVLLNLKQGENQEVIQKILDYVQLLGKESAADNILTIAVIKPRLISDIASILLDIKDENLKSLLLQFIFNNSTVVDDNFIKTTYFFFLHTLTQIGYYSEQEAADSLQKYLPSLTYSSSRFDKGLTHGIIFSNLWIARYYAKYYPADKFIKFARLRILEITKDKEFISQYKALEPNHDIQPLSQLLQSLINDDFEALEKMDIQPDAILAPELFSPYWMLQSNPTLAQVAAYFGSLNCLKYLSKITDISKTDSVGRTIHHFASASDNSSVIDFIQSIDNEFTGSLIHATLFHNRILFSKLKIDNIYQYAIKTCNIDALIKCMSSIPFENEFLLHEAASTNHIDVMELLLSTNKFDVNAWNKEKQTPLGIACLHNQLSMIKFLLSYSEVDVNKHLVNETMVLSNPYSPDDNTHPIPDKSTGTYLKSDIGFTPFHYAAVFGPMEMVNLLLSHKDIDVNATNCVYFLFFLASLHFILQLS